MQARAQVKNWWLFIFYMVAYFSYPGSAERRRRNRRPAIHVSGLERCYLSIETSATSVQPLLQGNSATANQGDGLMLT